MREGSTLITGKLPSTKGSVWEERLLLPEFPGVLVLLHLLLFVPLSLGVGLALNTFPPSPLIAMALSTSMVLFQAVNFAKHYVYYQTAAPARPFLALAVRNKFSEELTLSLIFFPVTAARGTLALIKHPRDALAAWCSYLTYRSTGPPGVFKSPAGDLSSRLFIFYGTGSIASVSVFRVPLLALAIEQKLSLPFILTILVTPIIACILVPLLLVAPYFETLREVPKSRFERSVYLQCSPNPTEAKSIPLGRLVADGSPFMVHEKTLGEGLHATGAPGSGKSAELASLSETIATRGGASVKFFNMKDKEDMAIFEGLRIGAERSGLPFLYFTLTAGKATHTFNLFKQRFWQNQTPLQKASLTGAGLGVTHGLEGYGKGHFGIAAFVCLLKAYAHYDPQNWKELGEKLSLIAARPRDYGLNKITAQAATQVMNECVTLSHVEAFNTETSSLDVSEPSPVVEYWTFPDGGDVAGKLARLRLYAEFAAADSSVPQHFKWIFIDECQRVMGNRLELLIQQGREKFGLILANQAMADLNTKDKDYRPTIQTCCRLHWSFNTSDKEEQLFASETSGKVVRERQIVSYSKIPGLLGSETRTYSPYETDRYGLNQMSIANADPRLSVISCSQDYGFVQYGGFAQILLTEFHISAKEYQRRKHAPWPPGGPDTITPGVPAPLGTPSPPLPKAPNIINPDQPSRRRRNRPR